MTAVQKKRPTGVTIIGILDLIGGIIGIFGGLGIAAAGAIFIGVSEDVDIPLEALENLGISEELFVPVFLAFGVFILGLGIALIIAAYGTFKAMGMAVQRGVGHHKHSY